MKKLVQQEENSSVTSSNLEYSPICIETRKEFNAKKIGLPDKEGKINRQRKFG